MTALDIRPLAEVIDFPAEHEPPDGTVTPSDVCQAAGITYRMLDYWTRTELVSAVWPDGRGSGRRRYYERCEVAVLTVMARLVAAGVEPRIAVGHARTLLDQGSTVLGGFRIDWPEVI